VSETTNQRSNRSNGVKRLIITADDFGLSRPVNEAIEEGHRQGYLTSASLMMGAEATADAVERARRLPTLKIGLHLVLADGSSTLPSYRIPDLVNRAGEFSPHLVRAGCNFFFRPRVKQQLEAEILAQFEAFRKTSIPLDHVNTHHHMHLHPTVSSLVLKVGRDYGLRAMRLPYEPSFPSWRASQNGFVRRTGASLLLWPWVSLLRKRLRHARVCSNDFVFGMNDSGRLCPGLMLRFLKFLPPGVGEIYFHPGDNAGELEALTHPAVREALLASQVQTISFSDLAKLAERDAEGFNRLRRGQG
jgi:hopanoid biosynthesis associated protein HpnK